MSIRLPERWQVRRLNNWQYFSFSEDVILRSCYGNYSFEKTHWGENNANLIVLYIWLINFESKWTSTQSSFKPKYVKYWFWSLFDALQEFLQANTLVRKVIQPLAIKKYNLNKKNNSCDWMQHGELFYKGRIEVHWIKLWKKHLDNSLASCCTTKNIYHILYHNYFWLNIYKQVNKYDTVSLIYKRDIGIYKMQPEEL